MNNRQLAMKEVPKVVIRAAIYARYSPRPSGPSESAEDQIRRCRAYCEMVGLNPTDVEKDELISGTIPLAERVGGSRLIALANARSVGAIVVARLDRAFRRMVDCLYWCDEWARLGITLHIVDLGGATVNTSSAAGKFMLQVLAAAAEMERNLLSERISTKIHEMNKVVGARGTRRFPPYGYKWDMSPECMRPSRVSGKVLSYRYIPDPERFELMELFFHTYKPRVFGWKRTWKAMRRRYRSKWRVPFDNRKFKVFMRYATAHCEYVRSDQFAKDWGPIFDAMAREQRARAAASAAELSEEILQEELASDDPESILAAYVAEAAKERDADVGIGLGGKLGTWSAAYDEDDTDGRGEEADTPSNDET